MTLGNFLDAAYVVLADEYRNIGTDLQTTLKELEPYRAGGPGAERDGDGLQVVRQERNEEARLAAENERGLAELQKMMAGTSFRR